MSGHTSLAGFAMPRSSSFLSEALTAVSNPRAAARGFDTAVKASDRKLEDLGIAKPAKEVCPDIRSSFRGLEHAERYLKDYKNGYAMVRNHTGRVLENER